MSLCKAHREYARDAARSLTRFDWLKTPQGPEYWYGVYEQLRKLHGPPCDKCGQSLPGED